jgi:hypothetical protein
LRIESLQQRRFHGFVRINRNANLSLSSVSAIAVTAFVRSAGAASSAAMPAYVMDLAHNEMAIWEASSA